MFSVPLWLITRKFDNRGFRGRVVSKPSLESLASFVRDLDSKCTLARLSENHIFAGSHGGELCCWSAESGDLRWRTEVSGPISDIAIDAGRIYATASASLHAFDAESGQLLWSRELEGGSDFVQAWSGVVWASSSVYELEIDDFIEATIWRFDDSGEQLERWTINERPWHFGLHEDGGVLLGLGRPRCGFLRIRPGEKAEHFEFATDSPVTCGACGSAGRFLLGHSDGSISSVGTDEGIEQYVESLVTTIAGTDSGFISGHEDGSIWFDGGVRNVDGTVDAIADLSGDGWASSWDGSESRVSLLAAEAREFSHDARIRHMDSRQNRLIFGDDLGKVILLESAVVKRRLEEDLSSAPENDRNQALRERLRMLRNS